MRGWGIPCLCLCREKGQSNECLKWFNNAGPLDLSTRFTMVGDEHSIHHPERGYLGAFSLTV